MYSEIQLSPTAAAVIGKLSVFDEFIISSSRSSTLGLLEKKNTDFEQL